MNIIGLKAFQDNYIWLLVDWDKKAAICVDPGEALSVLDYLAKHQLSLTAILLTHHHYDHINGVEKLYQKFPKVSLYGPNDTRLTDFLPINTQKNIHCLNWTFEVLATPGHTSSHICFWDKTANILFCGDTLFSAGCGRVFDGTIEDLFQSLQNLAALPAETNVYCGHEYTKDNLKFAVFVEPENKEMQKYLDFLENNPSLTTLPSTIHKELQINPFLRLTSTTIKNFVLTNHGNADNPLQIFTFLREQKNKFLL